MDTKTLTAGQRKVMETVHGRGYTHSGRGGWNRTTMEALERLGLFTRGKVHVHETDWKLTALGREVAAKCHAEFMETVRKG